MNFIDRNAKANKPFFCWFNTTRMHVFTHLKKESEGKTGLGIQQLFALEPDLERGEVYSRCV
jgi:arylsulfatase